MLYTRAVRAFCWCLLLWYAVKVGRAVGTAKSRHAMVKLVCSQNLRVWGTPVEGIVFIGWMLTLEDLKRANRFSLFFMKHDRRFSTTYYSWLLGKWGKTFWDPMHQTTTISTIGYRRGHVFNETTLFACPIRVFVSLDYEQLSISSITTTNIHPKVSKALYLFMFCIAHETIQHTFTKTLCYAKEHQVSIYGW